MLTSAKDCASFFLFASHNMGVDTTSNILVTRCHQLVLTGGQFCDQQGN